ncbi:MAG: hypothetical protein Q4F95_02705 [Oscillospiraceae bacterium]|nr:hypothetical protein [Oscillospiraceae bacterium]
MHTELTISPGEARGLSRYVNNDDVISFIVNNIKNDNVDDLCRQGGRIQNSEVGQYRNFRIDCQNAVARGGRLPEGGYNIQLQTNGRGSRSLCGALIDYRAFDKDLIKTSLLVGRVREALHASYNEQKMYYIIYNERIQRR